MKTRNIFREQHCFTFLAFPCLLVIVSGFSRNMIQSSTIVDRWQNELTRTFPRPIEPLKAITKDGFVESKTAGKEPKIVSEFKEVRRRVISFLKNNDYEGAKELIMGMFEYLQEDGDKLIGTERLRVCEAIDETLQVFFGSAFGTRGKYEKKGVALGMDLLKLQLSSNGVLESPYDTVPKTTLINALKALTRAKEVRHTGFTDHNMHSADLAYRILQRLVTGVGVRQVDKKKMHIYESDFNMVLNAYSNVGRMDMAHRVVALQERTPHAPVLSPVAYSILLKGYGRLGDLNNIEMLLTHAKVSKVEPDIIMVNSLLDAYIKCNEWKQAKEVFDCLRFPKYNGNNSVYQALFYPSNGVVIPNKRTYNIMLKGYATKALLKESLELASEMERLGVWDHVTTNTLVQAAVNAREFAIVEKILERHTEQTTKYRSGKHPNAEAYTSAIDGYAKSGQLQNATELLRVMRDRGVEPNEFTYTCLVGALAREKKFARAEKMIDIMKASGLSVGVVTYNSFISGLVERKDSNIDGEEFDRNVDSAIYVLRRMMKEGVRPTDVTVSVLVDAFGKCDRPRLTEAQALVKRLEDNRTIRRNNSRIMTALLQLYGASGDMKGALETFQRIRNPDIAAVNAFLDACAQCGQEKAADQIFDRYFRNPSSQLRPDVISYSIMIAANLKRGHQEASKHARTLYEEMKFQRRLSPDNALVDMILKGMIEKSKLGGGLTTGDVRFVASVLRDAENLEWRVGQLETRKRSIQTVMTGRIADAWEEEAGLFGLLDNSDSNEIFKRHGWNKVDSGFQLWGAKIAELNQQRKTPKDKFLESKGWNNVDSGFRII